LLHPLITRSKWLFGPEYDSVEYTSNEQLRSIAKKFFNFQDSDITDVNIKKRPDLFVIGDSCFSLTGVNVFNSDSKLFEIHKILLI
jgi:hypothetical protein